MARSWLACLVVALSLGLCWVSAETLALKNGKTSEGTFVGGSARQVEFLPSSGEAMKVSMTDVESLRISTPSRPTSPAAAAPAAKRPPVLIRSGASFHVRTTDPIDVDVAHARANCRGGIDDPIMAGGGRDVIELKVNSISVRDRIYPVVTSVSETKTSGEGKKTAGKVVGGAGLGSIIGGIAGGGTGAAIGALAGAAAGTAVAASGQPHLEIPAETRLEFALKADWKVQ